MDNPNINTDAKSLDSKASKSSNIILFIGIGVVIAVVIGLLLAYFLWYQKPEKIAADAVVNLIKSKELATIDKSNSHFKNGDVEVAVNFDSSSSLKKEGYWSDNNVKVNFKNKEIATPVFGVNIDPGNKISAFKAGNVQKSIESSINVLSDYYENSEYTKNMDAEQKKAAREQYKKTIDEQYNSFKPLIASFDNKWITITADDLIKEREEISDKEKNQIKCAYNKSLEIKKDKKYLDEFSSIYRKHPFIGLEVVKDAKAKNGATPYRPKANQEAFDKFFDSLNESQYVKDLIEECKIEKIDTNDKDKIVDKTSEAKSDVDNSEVIVYISQFRHRVTAVDTSTKQGDFEAKTSSEVKYHAKEDFKPIPKDQSKSIHDLIKEIEKRVQIPQQAQPEQNQEVQVL